MRKPLSVVMLMVVLSVLACNAPRPRSIEPSPTAVPATGGPAATETLPAEPPTAEAPTATPVAEVPPTTTPTTEPIIMCTPPPCRQGEMYYCPGDCPGGCGTQCATPTAAPLPPPTILSFTTDRTTIVAGESVNLAWQATGGMEVSICWVTREAILTCVQDPLDPDGGTVTITPNGPGRPGKPGITLTVRNSAGSAEARVEVSIACAEAPLPELANQQMYGNCPYGTVVGNAAHQAFQGGTMIWLEGNHTIYVFYANGRYESYPDHFQEGDPESDPAIVPPAGLYQPMRGFGLVWRTNQQVRDGVGWALAPEAGFQGWGQSYSGIGMHNSGTFIRAIDGSIYHLSHMGTAWNLFTP